MVSFGELESLFFQDITNLQLEREKELLYVQSVLKLFMNL